MAIKSLREKREGIVEGAEKAIGPELAALSAEEQRIYRQSVHERDLLATQLAALHAAEQSIVEEASRARLRRDDLANNIEQKEREHRVIASESQLHRVSASLAGWWMGKDYEPHTVPEGQVRRVSAVWFGSMAALGALGGAVVAMISQLLMKRSIAGETPTMGSSRGANTRPITRLLLTLRQILARRFSPARVKTIEVVKTQIKVVAVPVPVSNVSLNNLKSEFEALGAPLSEHPQKA